jgi:hypothetical protein
VLELQAAVARRAGSLSSSPQALQRRPPEIWAAAGPTNAAGAGASACRCIHPSPRGPRPVRLRLCAAAYAAAAAPRVPSAALRGARAHVVRARPDCCGAALAAPRALPLRADAAARCMRTPCLRAQAGERCLLSSARGALLCARPLCLSASLRHGARTRRRPARACPRLGRCLPQGVPHAWRGCALLAPLCARLDASVRRAPNDANRLAAAAW